ncbi:MAG: prepilin-type N-terminal cleavage/methylation domain-containing protein, partial [Burkholderiales bacterium]
MLRRAAGFTFIEILIVVAVLGVLIAMSLPAIKESAMRRQVKEGLALADVAKQGVA